MENDSFDPLLLQVIFTYQNAALQFLGKIKSPITDKIEKDLEQAKMFIDMLDMMKSKMKGNLTDQEESFLKNTLHDLHLNYVDEMNKHLIEENKASSGTHLENK